MLLIATIAMTLVLAAATATGSSGRDNLRKNDEKTPPMNWQLNSMWSSQPGRSGGWTSTGHTSNEAPPFRAQAASFQPQAWEQGPYNYLFPPSFMEPPTMYHPQNWQIGGYAYPPQQPMYVPQQEPLEMMRGMNYNRMYREDEQMVVDEDTTRQQRSPRPGPSRPPTTRYGCAPSPQVQEWPAPSARRWGEPGSQSRSPSRGKGKRRATEEDIAWQEEEDRRTRDEEYQRYLWYRENEIAREPTPREVRRFSEREGKTGQ
ncbi:uncharacterized protein ARMOST_19827 [Armillaria ostoyae]|uniref:Uncharacterized protein n=1 Tax=Armillaria ostoyae TaxID=47428 RepID=A0A284S5N5_ARMOS|nr:uncharacterized protein ARMOST_19827 [Armillaria ostoyae]